MLSTVPTLAKRSAIVLLLLAIAFWARALFFDQLPLPGAFLKGFAPFGNDPRAPWTILQWDSLAQYFPWRHFAASELRAGHIPLWNPYQFSGTPFVANGQSAVFYPLNLPFWIFDTAYAFAINAFLHTILALFGTYVLARQWSLSRSGAIIAAIAYAFCGYLSSWVLLPTLFATAAWLPLCLYLFELAADSTDKKKTSIAKYAFPLLVLCLSCALLAGHAQIFFYLVLALALRQPFLRRPLRGLGIGLGALALSVALCALQLLPTLEFIPLSHRALNGPRTLEATSADWQWWQPRALHTGDLAALFLPGWPVSGGTFNENFGYVGVAAALCAILGAVMWKKSGGLFASNRARAFALTLAVFGLLYAMATPVAAIFFFGVPGVSQMGGMGRALLLWSLGIALLAGFGSEWLKSRSGIAPYAIALVLVGELFANAFLTTPTAHRSEIYPKTGLTDYLQGKTDDNHRALFLTPRRDWLPTEAFRDKTHPSGILPPNGPMVYGIYDVNGYDSLSIKGYRLYIAGEEENGELSPQTNGNMVLLNNVQSPLLDKLGVEFVVIPTGFEPKPAGQQVWSDEGCEVWQRPLPKDEVALRGAAFYPGWRDGKYAPESFRFGAFISLCALSLLSALFMARRPSKNAETSTLPSISTQVTPTQSE